MIIVISEVNHYSYITNKAGHFSKKCDYRWVPVQTLMGRNATDMSRGLAGGFWFAWKKKVIMASLYPLVDKMGVLFRVHIYCLHLVKLKKVLFKQYNKYALINQ